MNSQNTERFLLPAGNRSRQRILVLAVFLLLLIATLKLCQPLWDRFPSLGPQGLIEDPLSPGQFLGIFVPLAVFAVLLRVLLWLKALWDRITAWTKLPESPETGKR